MDIESGTKEGRDKGRIEAEDATSKIINNQKSQPQEKVGKLEIIME